MAAGRRTNDPLRHGGVRRGALIAAAALIVLGLASMGACGTNEAVHGLGPTGQRSSGTEPSACGPGSPGCECPKDGATASCGRVESKSGNYVTCSVGYSTCTGGSWGPCIGNHLVTKSMPNVALSISGIHVLSQPIACTNVCDPKGCMATQGDPGDVDAAGFMLGDDGSVTLQDAALNLDAGCVGLTCDIASCGGTLTTTLSGTVYDPAGNNPLYNAYVYIPINPLDPLPPMGAGASCDTCGGAAGLAAVQVTQTDAAGNFTLTNVPTAPNLPVVVQMGKWRREVVLNTITSCQSNSIAGNCTTPDPADCVFRLPRNQTDGYDPVAGTYSKADLPQIAIVTGKSDPFDCLLLKAGIDPQEFGDYTSNARIHFYQADGPGGGDSLDPAYGMNVPGSQLWSNLNPDAPMALYDAILLPCEGAAYDRQASGQTPYQNLISYVDSGGRVFTTHFGYTWLQYPAGKNYVPAPDNWASLADWSPTGPAMTSTVDTQDPLTGVVNTGFPKGAVYSQWLQNSGATTAPAQLTIHQGRQDLETIGKGVQGWMTAQDTEYPAAPNYTNLFTFNTPLGAAANAQCGRVVYSDFHVSAGALVAPTGQCLSDADCGFSATCQGATAGAVGQCNEPCGTSADCPHGSFACEGAATGTCDQAACARNSDCGTGRACVNKVCACTSNSDCNGGGCGAMTCSPVSCSSNAQCGKGTCGAGKCTVSTAPCHANKDCGLGTCRRGPHGHVQRRRELPLERGVRHRRHLRHWTRRDARDVHDERRCVPQERRLRQQLLRRGRGVGARNMRQRNRFRLSRGRRLRQRIVRRGLRRLREGRVQRRRLRDERAVRHGGPLRRRDEHVHVRGLQRRHELRNERGRLQRGDVHVRELHRRRGLPGQRALLRRDVQQGGVRRRHRLHGGRQHVPGGHVQHVEVRPRHRLPGRSLLGRHLHGARVLRGEFRLRDRLRGPLPEPRL